MNYLNETEVQRIEGLKSIIDDYLLNFIDRINPIEEMMELITSAAEIVLSRESKRIRSMIPILISEEGFCKREDALKYSALIELLHFSSLIHDDVIDDD